jgi:cysteinyl-tRNA synthetase
LLRLDEWVHRLRDIAGSAAPDLDFAVAQTDDFFEALDDDLNISAALAAVFDQVRAANRLIDHGRLTASQAAALLRWWDRINQVLQLQEEEERIPENIHELLRRRDTARAGKNWAVSDALRMQIEALGWKVKDTKDGQKLSRKSG